MKRITPEAAEEYFLMNAAPETVYEYLREHMKRGGNSNKEVVSEEFQKKLLERKHPIIDLALAQFAEDEDVHTALLKKADPKIRTAVFSNSNRFVPYALLSEERYGRISEKEFVRLITKGEPEDIQAFFTNPGFSEHALAAALKREEKYADLPESRWQLIVSYALHNPNLNETPGLDFSGDGWGHYSKSKPFMVAYELLLTVEPTREWASVLDRGFEKMDDWSPATEMALKNVGEEIPEPLSSSWHEAQDRGEKLFLEQVFERWKTPDPEDMDKIDERYGTVFDHLRQSVASRVPHFERSDLLAWMSGHPDKWVRRGYYQAFDPESSEQLEEYFQRDQVHFLDAALRNLSLYRNDSDRRAKISLTFYKIVHERKSKDMDSEDYNLMSVGYEGQLRRLHEAWPNIFPKDADEFYRLEFDLEDDDPTTAAEITLENLEQAKIDIKEIATRVSQTGEDTGGIFRMVEKISEMIVDQSKDFRASLKEVEERFGVSLYPIISDLVRIKLWLAVAIISFIAYAIFKKF